jgi:glutaredoxin-like protein
MQAEKLGWLNASLRGELQGFLAGLPRPVTLLAFVRQGCGTCAETQDLVEGLASLSDGKIQVEVYDLDAHPIEAGRHAVDKAPAVVVLGGETGRRDFGIRFYGLPDGYEFATLIEDIRMASETTTDLSPATLDLLAHLATPLHLRVFVTPTCPYCPRAVLLTHKMAIASERVTAEVVDAAQFPELAREYQVYGVPRTIINDTVHVEGAVPESMLMAELIPLLEPKVS